MCVEVIYDELLYHGVIVCVLHSLLCRTRRREKKERQKEKVERERERERRKRKEKILIHLVHVLEGKEEKTRT